MPSTNIYTTANDLYIPFDDRKRTPKFNRNLADQIGTLQLDLNS